MEKESDDLLQGKTLKIYWYLLTHGESGVREIKRHLKIPSPSTVSYHISKLVDAGLVSKSETDKYLIEEKVQTGILGLYVKIGKRMIPRMVFYISFFAIGLLLYFVVIINRDSTILFTEDFLFLFFSISGLVFFSYEAYNIATMKPL